MTDKRQQIITAAVKVFAREGLDKGRIADIAREAGVGKGTVYEYFRSKEELFNAIAADVAQDTLQILEEISLSDGSAREKLERFINDAMEMTTQMGDAIILMTEIWAQGARGQWHGSGSELVDMYQRMHEKVRVILRAGMDSGEFRKMNLDGVAALLLAFGDGLMWQYILFPDKPYFEEVKEEAIKSFLGGIAK